MKKFLILICVSFLGSAHAIGTLNVSGKVASFDEKTVTLKLVDGSSIKMQKSALKQSDRDNLRPDMQISALMDNRDFKKAHTKAKKK